VGSNAMKNLRFYLSQRRRVRREIQNILSAVMNYPAATSGAIKENIILPTLHALAGQK
jgi:hypothetical protein